MAIIVIILMHSHHHNRHRLSMPRMLPLARIDSRMLAVDNESNAGGDTLPAGVIGDVFGQGIDDENYVRIK